MAMAMSAAAPSLTRCRDVRPPAIHATPGETEFEINAAETIDALPRLTVNEADG
jgi:hypothetical protein